MPWRFANEAWVRAECARWLATVLLPHALDVARVEAAPVAEILGRLRERDEIRRLDANPSGEYWNEREAVDGLSNLRVVAIAIVVAHWAAAVDGADDVRDVIRNLAYLDALERSIACELAQDAADALYPDGSDSTFDQRARLADEQYERWRALDPIVEHLLAEWMTELAEEMRPS